MLEKLSIVQQWVLWFWNMLGVNSGQIQIVIAIVALIYAWRAYKKVLEQIKISLNQDLESHDQRSFELKVEMMNLNLKIIEIIHSKMNLLHEFEVAVNDTPVEDNSEGELEDKEAILKVIASKIEETEYLQKLIFESAENLNRAEEFDYKKHRGGVRDIYLALILALKSSNEIELLKTRFITDGD